MPLTKNVSTLVIYLRGSYSCLLGSVNQLDLSYGVRGSPFDLYLDWRVRGLRCSIPGDFWSFDPGVLPPLGVVKGNLRGSTNSFQDG